MATRRNSSAREETPKETAASDIVTTPPGAGFAHHDHSFTLQAIFDLKSAVTELNVNVKQLQQTAESTKSKVSELSDLRHKIVGGMVVIGIFLTAVSGIVLWGANKTWDLVAEVARPAIKKSIAEINEKPTVTVQGSPAPQVPGNGN